MTPYRLTPRLILLASLGATLAFSLPAGAAMYKWVDEHGTTHYGDSVPPKYASRASDRNGKPVVPPAKIERSQPAASTTSEAQSEQQKAEAKRQLDRQRQDTALMSTYASEHEIELARKRELERAQDMLKIGTAGLARSDKAEDRRKLEALMDRSRQETDAINARFDAQLARYRELTGQAQSAAAVGARDHSTTSK